MRVPVHQLPDVAHFAKDKNLNMKIQIIKCISKTIYYPCKNNANKMFENQPQD